MFENVREPTAKESELLELLGPVAKYPNREAIFMYLSNSQKEESNESNNEGNNPQGTESDGKAVSGTERHHPKTEPTSEGVHQKERSLAIRCRDFN